MRLNKYTVRIANGQKTILYNLITKALIEVDYELRDCDAKNLLKDENAEMRNFLKESLIISEDNNDDFKEFLSLKRQYDNSEIGRFIIHLGYMCNLRCSYCYQTTLPLSAKKQVIDVCKVVSFIMKCSKMEKYKKLDISFIGGEPLLYLAIIRNIAQILNKEMKTAEIFYSVVTNGTLLTKKVIKILSPLNINEYQVTLDGIKDYHDKCRHGNIRGSFDRIIKNLKDIKDNREINISINCNISTENYKGVELLLEYLSTNNLHFPLFFSLVFNNGINKIKEIKKTSDIWFNIHKKAMEYGYSFEPFYREMYLGCSMTQRNSHIIGADGNLYKCINAVGNSKYFLCDMNEYGEIDYEKKIAKFLDYKIDRKECEDCELYPVCNGGCEYNNSINGFSCAKEQFYKNDIPLIKELVNAKNRSN